MIDLARYTELVVRQEVEHLEVFVGFETANRYSIHTPEGGRAMYAAEESGALTRQFMGTHRPLTIRVVDSGGQPVLTASRKFYWFYSHLHVVDEAGSPIGSLKRQFAMMRRRFSLLDANASQIGRVDGGPFRRNTFTVENGQGVELGRIVKQWSGLAREAFSDADTFQIQFSDQERSQEFRLMLLAAAFAIDLEFFEDKGRRGPG
jgi:uncharacterized protein YxjI